jgi:type IV secretory pathway VirB2 component (pilin)
MKSKILNTIRLKPVLKAETILTLVILVALCASPCYADFDSSLLAIKTKLTGTILPALAVMGLTFASFSFLTGNQNAKQHIIYAVGGCLLGFGAQAIVDLISRTVR